jgi:hypothetical protein
MLITTDGSINKLVMLSRKFIMPVVTGYPHLTASKLLHSELFIAPAGNLYRDTAQVALDFIPYQISSSHLTSKQSNLSQIQKIVHKILQKSGNNH